MAEARRLRWPEPTLKWMYWAGLFVTTADVLIALAITESSTRDS
ncbi:hypothetical protein [Mycobacterium sp. 141]|nr:hypothetical protein [Mycobacterium sp. 141]